MFNALVLRNDPVFCAAVEPVDDSLLSAGDVLLDVDYSTLNYKDSLAITNSSPIVRNWPMIAGIDGAGTVVESRHSRWQPGDRVVLNGWGVGENHSGCLAQRARLNGDWLVAVPDNMSTRQTMAVGTAGYTAMLCVRALERFGLTPDMGEVLVTGATGGVGSVAIMLLSALGYQVVAATGKTSEVGYLTKLGAAQVIDRKEISSAGKPLQKPRWAAAVDSVGSHTLANVCAQLQPFGAVTACGLAQGADFTSTVMPFILRGVSLLGIDSVQAPMAMRIDAWSRLGRNLDLNLLDSITTEITLAEAILSAEKFMSGGVRGRFVVDVNR